VGCGIGDSASASWVRAVIKVVHFQRRPAAGQVSIERVFDQVRQALPGHVDCAVQVSPQYSRGVVERLDNLRHAAGHIGPINHITGDVHYLAAGLEGRRTVLTVHDCASLRRLRGIRRAVLRWLWYKWPMQRVAVVTAVSESVRRELVREVGCDEAKIRVIHNCVRNEFKPVWKRFNEAYPVLLQVGTGGTKNVERMVAALTGLRCRLKIIGRLSAGQARVLGEAGAHYTNLPQASDQELVEAYQQCDLVVFVSSYEGFGLPIIEANATGRPVVTSRVWSMPEVAGGAACLVDPLDAEAIRAGVARVLNDKAYRERLVEAGLENVKRFSAKRIAEGYARVYEELGGFDQDGNNGANLEGQ
jgi:glycosyltransferase involved in cell wall biosynthesis